MNSLVTPNKSKHKDDFEDDDIFEDSTFLANFQNSSFKNNVNDSLNASALNVSALCCDEEINGYDKLSGKTWIYPTNYPVRDYQFNIIKTALLKNTLVSLPTGLGKTFIAAVIMYNFYRWYPLGKIVFTAPTRPLVAQQIDACYNIIAIPQNDTVEMTGHMQVNTRKTHWQNKRVFFATPQVVYNDLKSGICPGDKIRCLVIDEAHRARKNYAYCQIVSSLDDIGHKTYRMLALSATPGSKVEDVATVIKNLHIAHLELRTEDCIDVAPFSHSRKIHTVVIQLGDELTQLRHHYVEILDYYARRLKQMNILPQNLGNLSKGRVVMLYKEFQTKDRGSRHPQHNYIMKDFTVLIALYHGLELLQKHGSRVFLNFFDEHPEKSWIQSDDKLTALLERLRDDLGINPLSLNTSSLPDGTIPEIPRNLCFGHPKFDKLKEIIIEHFTNAKQKCQDTRAIVFCEYRESVNLVHCMLLQCRPLVTPQMFVGQGASGKDGRTVVSQKQQLRVMRSFREGACNTLIATCVAEEGLDVGSVDLILCFDISTRSPIRLVQRNLIESCQLLRNFFPSQWTFSEGRKRKSAKAAGPQRGLFPWKSRIILTNHPPLVAYMCIYALPPNGSIVIRCGRTGRERGGQVYILVTDGREHQTLMDCMRQRDGLNRKIMNSLEIKNSLYKMNPRMMPHGFTPECQKMHMSIEKKNSSNEKKGQKDLLSMLCSNSKAVKQRSRNDMINETNFKELFPDSYFAFNNLESPKEYWNINRATLQKYVAEDNSSKLKLSTLVEWQRSLHKTIQIHHSRDSEILCDILRYSATKRSEIAQSMQKPDIVSEVLATHIMPTSVPIKSKLSKKKQKAMIKSPGKRDGDIRALFSVATKSTKDYTKLITELGVPSDGSVPTSLINLLVDISVDNNRTTSKCCVCENIFNCNIIPKRETGIQKRLTFLNDMKLPNIDLMDDINKETLLKCRKTNDVIKVLKEPRDCIDDANDCSHNFDLEFDFGSPTSFDSPNKVEAMVEQKTNLSNNFDIGDIDDIFANDSPLSICEMELPVQKKEVKDKEALGFFGLESIDDIFADSEDGLEIKSEISTKEQNDNTNTPEHEENKSNFHINNLMMSPTKEFKNIEDFIEHSLSPSVLSGRTKLKDSPKSPILLSQSQKLQRNQQSKNFTQMNNEKEVCSVEFSYDEKEALKTNTMQKNRIDTTDKSMFTISQLVEMINKTQNDEKSIKSKASNLHCKNDAIDKKERSVSPILQTQSMIKITSKVNTLSHSPKINTKDSLVILDSDSNDTQEYDLDAKLNNEYSNNYLELNTHLSPQQNVLHTELLNQNSTQKSNSGKRQLEMDDSDTMQSSPYFNKKLKLDNTSDNKTKLTLQEKVLAAITSQKLNLFNINPTIDNFNMSQTNITSQKENKNPRVEYNELLIVDTLETNMKSQLKTLQQFRRDVTKSQSCKNNFNGNLDKMDSINKLTFDESDDDFITDEKCYRSPRRSITENKSPKTNHRVRKKNKKENSFLDLEAELSDKECNSGDELSDSSVGSIADFICDENVTHHENMHAHYLKSVRSPVKCGFKIPQLPMRYDKAVILSQNAEDDNYEMDSFCVDSHFGLTQVNDLTDLELAEIALEEEKRAKRRRKCPKSHQEEQNGESPEIKRKKKYVKRQIHSDSDDST